MRNIGREKILKTEFLNGTLILRAGTVILVKTQKVFKEQS